ncbi:MAG: DNA gyrase/topoisomerase IV subunit A, partial [Odoribacter sp.]|nr:DNA gyrase/topoisomerase IV subunit A [Odoribacter sp.]
MSEDIIEPDLNPEEKDETQRDAVEHQEPTVTEELIDDGEAPVVVDDEGEENGSIRSIQHLDGMYQKWFLDYASYVILERAVPNIDDGLKPVQRRILHSMKTLDDGRFNKVANIVGNTMQY